MAMYVLYRYQLKCAVCAQDVVSIIRIYPSEDENYMSAKAKENQAKS